MNDISDDVDDGWSLPPSEPEPASCPDDVDEFVTQAFEKRLREDNDGV